MMINELEIISSIKKGKNEKLSIIMDKYSDRMKKTAYLITGDDKLSEDCVQETFIRFYYNISQFRAQSSLGTYLYRILVNICNQKLRRSWFKRVKLNGDFVNVRQVDDYEEKVILRVEIKRSLQMLDKKYREVLILFYFNQMTVNEISQILEMKQGTIKSRLMRAREKIKPYLEKGGLGNGFSASC